MDELDRADIYNQMNLEAALTLRKPEGPRATGYCLCCEEPSEKRWCNADCRDEWEKENG